ncbi:hypothetical protein CYMTET_33179 [Cymbomonas tetramitiformis]|uniref:Uncharacterized protein n=1 Tax=Cymbomonas tetramitiformis TaxID=36881 RepID=A0AAE0KR54_9CHLO|nr:hypothetical protein CYMTET_33179 [Cymbomonas tetramitiformis]
MFCIWLTTAGGGWVLCWGRPRQPGCCPTPGSVLQHSVAVQAAPCPWMRYYFSAGRADGGDNAFLKHFDVWCTGSTLDRAKFELDYPGDMAMVAPAWLRNSWKRLYCAALPDNPKLMPRLSNDVEWRQVKMLESQPIDFGGPADDIPADKWIDMLDFCQYVSQLEPRSSVDKMPLLDLCKQLVSFLLKQIKEADFCFKRRSKQMEAEHHAKLEGMREAHHLELQQQRDVLKDWVPREVAAQAEANQAVDSSLGEHLPVSIVRSPHCPPSCLHLPPFPAHA